MVSIHDFSYSATLFQCNFSLNALFHHVIRIESMRFRFNMETRHKKCVRAPWLNHQTHLRSAFLLYRNNSTNSHRELVQWFMMENRLSMKLGYQAYSFSMQKQHKVINLLSNDSAKCGWKLKKFDADQTNTTPTQPITPKYN